MERKYKRALWGYRKKDVENMVAEFENDVESIKKNYEKEKVRLQGENQRLKREIEQAESKMQGYKNNRKQLETKLYESFTAACLKVYETERQFDEIIENKNQALKNQQDVNFEIKSSTGRLLEQIRLIAGRG